VPIQLMSPDASIFDSGADALVCPVNCVGVPGKGLALEFKKRFPEEVAMYIQNCRTRGMVAGECYMTMPSRLPFRTIFDPPWICFLPTKNHWRSSSRIEWVAQGLDSLRAHVDGLWHLKSIAIPALGCGLGGLAWADVLPLIEQFADDVDPVTVMVYPPKEG